jgi:hypothetical protein
MENLESVLNKYNLSGYDNLLSRTRTRSVLTHINCLFRSLLTEDDNDILLLLAYDFDTESELCARLDSAIPMMKERGRL